MRGDTEGNDHDRSFEAFVAARSPSLTRTAYLLLGGREAAEDLVQSALEKTYPRWRRVRRMESPEAYVRRILVNDATDTRHRRRRDAAADARFAETAPAAAPDGTDRLALRDGLMRALDELPKGMRAVVVLRYWDELPVQEVADLLGCSPGNVKAQAFRGLERLRSLITVAEGADGDH